MPTESNKFIIECFGDELEQSLVQLASEAYLNSDNYITLNRNIE